MLSHQVGLARFRVRSGCDPKWLSWAWLSPTAICSSVLVTLLLTSRVATGQIARIANDEPEIHANIGGRAGACDVLTFTADGKTLLAAGEDKIVHRWNIGPTGLRALPPLHWNTFRERRGAIYALAASADPAQPKVAIGGFGKLNADVAVFNLQTGQLLGSLSPLSDPKGVYSEAGEAIWALAFHPSGTELAIGDAAGNIWRCPLDQEGRPLAAGVRRAVTGAGKVLFETRVVWVGYLNGQLLYAKRDGGVYLAGKNPPLFQWEMGKIDKVVASGDGRWLAARPAKETEQGSSVEVRSLEDMTKKHLIPFKRGQFPDRIALDQTGQRIAVGLSDDPKGLAKLFAVEALGYTVVYDLSGADPMPLATSRSPGQPEGTTRPDQIAFHPDGKRLAIADAPDHGTSLWEITAGTLNRVSHERGEGRSLWAVGMTGDGRYLSFKDHRNPAPDDPNERATPTADWVSFDLGPGPRGWAAGPKEPIPPEKQRDGWTVTFDKKDKYVCYAVEPGGKEHKIPLDRLRDDLPRCYTFLPQESGPNPRGVRLAVGHLWGVSVFDLAPGQEPVRVRLLVGHAGYVTAVAPTHGGHGLISCGTDQLIAMWSLADFPSQPILGAAFKEENGSILVISVDPGSPAYEAGLSEGDVISKLEVGTLSRPRAEWLRDLRNPQPNRELAIDLTREGKPKETKTAVLHRPLARFLPLRNGEWVLYTYRQSYYDRSTNGDRYIEWQSPKPLSDLATGPPTVDWFRPDVFPVERFAKFLYRPAKVTDVVLRLNQEPGKPILPDLFPPKVSVAPLPEEVKDGQVLKIVVTVIPQKRQDDRVNPVDRVELWLNGHHRVGLKPLQGEKFVADQAIRVDFEVPATDLRDGANEFRAVGIGADDPGRGCGDGISRAVTVRLAAGRGFQRRLFGVFVGIADYTPLHPFGLKSLPGAGRDAHNMYHLFSAQQNQGAVGNVGDPAERLVLLQDHQVTKAAVLAAIDKVGRTARPEDLFVCCLAGHGHVMQKDWLYLVPPRGEEAPFGPDPLKQEAWLRTASVLDRELADALAKLKCQSIVLIDCCQSGAVVQLVGNSPAANATRALRPNGFGPVVIAACAPDQSSFEARFRGIFSLAVQSTLSDGFNTADANRDGQLSVAEFFAAVQQETIQSARSLGHNQTPQITPPADNLGDVVVATRPLFAPAPSPLPIRGPTESDDFPPITPGTDRLVTLPPITPGEGSAAALPSITPGTDGSASSASLPPITPGAGDAASSAGLPPITPGTGGSASLPPITPGTGGRKPDR